MDKRKKRQIVTAIPTLKPRRIVLEAGRAERNYWSDLWRYRELFAIFAWRDVTVRYKQTLIGVAWAILRPFLTMVIFTIVFGHVAKLPTDGATPYPVLVLAGLLPWFLFSSILAEASASLIGNANLIRKIYFPRIILPSSMMIAALVDFSINFALFCAVLVWFGLLPDWRIVLLPLFLALAIVVSLGPALLITALSVKYRDFRYIVPFIIQLGLYVSPVGFSSAAVPEQWRFWYSLNPLVGVIDGFRWCLLGDQSQIYPAGLASSVIVSAVFLWIGISYFRRTERTFADMI
jgi:lipopolysaccharide transport system permease protein